MLTEEIILIITSDENVASLPKKRADLDSYDSQDLLKGFFFLFKDIRIIFSTINRWASTK